MRMFCSLFQAKKVLCILYKLLNKKKQYPIFIARWRRPNATSLIYYNIVYTRVTTILYLYLSIIPIPSPSVPRRFYSNSTLNLP